MALLERSESLNLLSSAVDPTAGGGRIVLVSGEVGIGKSELIRAFVGAATESGATVAVGACDDFAAPPPFGPFRDMARVLGGDLERVFSTGAGRHEVFSAIHQALGQHGVTVAVVEELHWADEATLDAIRYVSRRLHGVPCTLVLTFRDDEVDVSNPLRRLLGLLTDSDVLRVRREPLSLKAVTELSAATTLDPEDIHAVSGGNPFFVSELLASEAQSVPTTVSDAVLGRVGQLDENVQDALAVLSIIPGRAEHWLAEAIHVTGSVFEAAERRNIVRVNADGIQFRHELARRAVEASLTAGQRIELNRRVLKALEGTDSGASRLMHHAVASNSTDSIRTYGPLAASEAARAASHSEATTHHEQLLAHG